MRTETRYPNGVTQFVVYDAANRLQRIYAQRVPGGPILTDFTYCYMVPLDAGCTGGPETDTGLRQRVTDKDGNATIYEYDVLGRLKTAEERNAAGTVLKTYQYDHDANGNRCAQRITAGSAPSPLDDCNDPADATTTTYSHNAADQLLQATTGAGTTTFAYDANGNETARSDGRAAAYNSKDQTTSMTPPGGSAIATSYTGTGSSVASPLGPQRSKTTLSASAAKPPAAPQQRMSATTTACCSSRERHLATTTTCSTA